MMKQVFAILLLFIVQYVTAADVDAFPFPRKRFPFPWDGHHALPPRSAIRPRFPGPPSPSIDPKAAQKCLQDFRIEQGCVSQILHSFGSRNIKLDPSCCSVVSAISQDCVSSIFAHFNNPFFAGLLKQHCSSAPTTPTPPTPSTPKPPSPSKPSPPSA